VCRNHVFAEFFKQTSVEASRFDVIDDFYCGIQHILQGVTIIFPLQLQNKKIFTSPEHLHLLFSVPHKIGTPLLMSPE